MEEIKSKVEQVTNKNIDIVKIINKISILFTWIGLGLMLFIMLDGIPFWFIFLFYSFIFTILQLKLLKVSVQKNNAVYGIIGLIVGLCPLFMNWAIVLEAFI